MKFIGRSRELATLQEQYSLASDGQARIALLAGEPGIGKTRLMLEFTGRASSQGATVLRGGASEAEGMPPYLPLLEALGHYIKSAPLDPLRAQLGDSAATLSAIFPEIAARLANIPSNYTLPLEQSRLRLYEAVGDLVRSIASTSPLVLLIDDLHWADSATVDLLTHIARHASEIPTRLLLLGTYRPGDARNNPHLGRTLHEWSRLRLLVTLPVSPLPAAEIADLAHTYLDAEAKQARIDPAIASLLYKQSEGNPFFAEELLNGWLEDGTLALTQHGWEVAPTVNEQASLPQTILAAVQVRLSRLSPQLLDDLRMASIIGRTFDIDFLAEVLGVDAEHLEDRLAQAVRGGLISGSADGTYTFSHDKIRESLYSEVTPTRRRRLHGFIGRVLESRPDRSAQSLADLAFHYAHSGDRERGAHFSRLAGDQAISAYAPMEAAAHYNTALSLMNPTDPTTGDILLSLGEASILVEDMDAAAKAFEQAQVWFSQRSNSPGASRASYGIGRVAWRLEHVQEAAAHLKRALALTDELVPNTVDILCDLATLMSVSLSQQDESVVLARRAYDLAQSMQDERRLAIAMRTFGNMLVRSRRINEGMPLLQCALDVAGRIDDPVEAAECCACMAIGYAWLGQFKQSAEITRERLKYAQQSRQPFQLRHVYAWLAMNHVALGEIPESARLLSLSEPAVESLASPEPRAFYALGVGYLAYMRGDYEVAIKHAGEAIEIFRQIGPGTLAWYLGIYAIFLAAYQKWDELSSVTAELEQISQSLQPGAVSTMEAVTPLALIAAITQDRALAARSYPRLLPFRGLFADNLIERGLGECATLLGDYSAAWEHLRAAEAHARRDSLLPELARTLRAQANLVAAEAGDKRTDREIQARYAALLTDAIALFHKIGMKGEEAQAQSLLALTSTTPRKQALPAGLSLREAEVLRLVASGLTSRDIAARLFLSEKTVANHITNIFLKTGTTNRVEASAFAIRHNLASSD